MTTTPQYGMRKNKFNFEWTLRLDLKNVCWFSKIMIHENQYVPTFMSQLIIHWLHIILAKCSYWVMKKFFFQKFFSTQWPWTNTHSYIAYTCSAQKQTKTALSLLKLKWIEPRAHEEWTFTHIVRHCANYTRAVCVFFCWHCIKSLVLKSFFLKFFIRLKIPPSDIKVINAYV